MYPILKAPVEGENSQTCEPESLFSDSLNTLPFKSPSIGRNLNIWSAEYVEGTIHAPDFKFNKNCSLDSIKEIFSNIFFSDPLLRTINSSRSSTAIK